MILKKERKKKKRTRASAKGNCDSLFVRCCTKAEERERERDEVIRNIQEHGKRASEREKDEFASACIIQHEEARAYGIYGRRFSRPSPGDYK